MVALVNHDQREVREAQVALLLKGLPKHLRCADEYVRLIEGILPIFGSPTACGVASYLNHTVSPDKPLIWRLETLGAHPLELLVRQQPACTHREGTLLGWVTLQEIIDGQDRDQRLAETRVDIHDQIFLPHKLRRFPLPWVWRQGLLLTQR